MLVRTFVARRSPLPFICSSPNRLQILLRRVFLFFRRKFDFEDDLEENRRRPNLSALGKSQCVYIRRSNLLHKKNPCVVHYPFVLTSSVSHYVTTSLRSYVATLPRGRLHALTSSVETQLGPVVGAPQELKCNTDMHYKLNSKNRDVFWF